MWRFWVEMKQNLRRILEWRAIDMTVGKGGGEALEMSFAWFSFFCNKMTNTSTYEYWNYLKLTRQLDRRWEGWQSGQCLLVLRLSSTQPLVALTVSLLNFAKCFQWRYWHPYIQLYWRFNLLTLHPQFQAHKYLAIGGTVEKYMWKPAPTDFWSKLVKF